MQKQSAIHLLAALLTAGRCHAQPGGTNDALSSVMRLPLEQGAAWFDQYYLDHYWFRGGITLVHNKAVGWWMSVGRHGFRLQEAGTACLVVCLVGGLGIALLYALFRTRHASVR